MFINFNPFFYILIIYVRQTNIKPELLVQYAKWFGICIKDFDAILEKCFLAY